MHCYWKKSYYSYIIQISFQHKDFLFSFENLFELVEYLYGGTAGEAGPVALAVHGVPRDHSSSAPSWMDNSQRCIQGGEINCPRISKKKEGKKSGKERENGEKSEKWVKCHFFSSKCWPFYNLEGGGKLIIILKGDKKIPNPIEFLSGLPHPHCIVNTSKQCSICSFLLKPNNCV